jgi:hypothetical protein
MSAADDPDPRKETIFLHDISPQLQKELLRRAESKGKDPAHEAAEIIESHLEENSDDLS